MSLAPGTIFADRYRIQSLLGKGGMGEVFEAEHLETHSPVAIKLLREEASDIIVERFSREGKALAQMQSEHVIRVFDVGVLGSGRPFIVMERLHGSDLSVVKKQRGTLPVSLAVSYVLQACAGLADAHGLGIVHRDLKPANLFRAELEDGRDVIKILDFGISKVNAAAKDGKTGLTEAGSSFGSPRYMPPEQLRDAKDVDARTDIWSLGVTLAELVTGRTSFHADDFGTLMFNILEEEPASVAHIDPALDAAVRKCLAKDRSDRFQSIEELAAALAPLTDMGDTQAELVSQTLRRAQSRVTELEARAAPQVTRVLEATDDNTTAVLRISIAPVTATLPGLPAAPVAQPQHTRTGPPLKWVAIVGAIAAGSFGAGMYLSSTDAPPDKAIKAEKKKVKDKPKSRKRKRARPTATVVDKPTLPADVAVHPAYMIAPEIIELLKETRPGPIEVRELLFFRERAVLVVSSGGELARYDYAKGRLSDPKPAKVTTGFRRKERIPLDAINPHVVSETAKKAQSRFGDDELHSISLQWLENDTVWASASKAGKLARYHLDGVPLDP